jgi:hypothetical protein
MNIAFRVFHTSLLCFRAMMRYFLRVLGCLVPPPYLVPLLSLALLRRLVAVANALGRAWVRLVSISFFPFFKESSSSCDVAPLANS